MDSTRSKYISPTAHYTGYVWARNGLSHPMLATPQGRLFYNAMAPLNAASVAVGGPTLEGLLLARHAAIDALLTGAIEQGRVTQIIEIAAGLSPRGWRFTERYGNDITYLETDLPGMATRKRTLLAKMGAKPAYHRVAELNALADLGPTSLAALASDLKPEQGTAIITEGLLNYFDMDNVNGLWRRIAECLQTFSHGVYLSDIFLGIDNRGLLGAGFKQMLSAFVRSPVHFHFHDADEANLALVEAGFVSAEAHRPGEFLNDKKAQSGRGASRVRVLEARS